MNTTNTNQVTIKEVGIKGRKCRLQTYLDKFLSKHATGTRGMRIPQADLDAVVNKLKSLKGLVTPVIVTPTVVENVTIVAPMVENTTVTPTPTETAVSV